MSGEKKDNLQKMREAASRQLEAQSRTQGAGNRRKKIKGKRPGSQSNRRARRLD